MTRVFISSTAQDLADYRRAAIDTALRLQMTPIAMEHFEAMGRRAGDGSRLHVDDADLYVGIVAHRYGYVEPGADRSVTEAEFDRAGERGLDRLCFLVDPAYPWPPDAMDLENHQRLQAFKARIESHVIRGQFTTVDNFSLLLLQALEQWQRRRGVAGPPAADHVPAVGWALPPSPALFVGREADLRRLKTRLGVGAEGRGARRTIVRGWPGMGKTTTILTLARDPEVAARFGDGVLWASPGQHGDVVAGLAEWARHLGSPLTGEVQLETVMAHVRALLGDRRMLLVVDDVWELDDAMAFNVGGDGCATLFTTRLADLARELAPDPEDVHVLRALSEDEMLELFTQLAPRTFREHADELRRLGADLEGLPLALRVAARLLEAETSMGWGIDDLLRELADGRRLLGERAPEDRFDPAAGTIPTVAALLRQSTDRLDAETRDRFAILGAFAPKPASFDLEAMRETWEVEDARPTARILADRGLLEPLLGTGRFQLHALLVDHARSLLE